MQFQFNATQVAPSVPLEVIPADWYVLLITASELSPTKDKDGAYLNLTAEVGAGPYKGRKQFLRFNVQNSNAQAVEIAYRDLSALCHATGVLNVQDTQQLHNIPFEAKIIVRAAEGKYPETNDVRGFRAMNSGQKPAGNGVGVVHTPSAAPQGAPAGPVNNAPPANWGAANPAAGVAPGSSAPWQQPQAAQQAPQQAPQGAPWQQAQPQQPVQQNVPQNAPQAAVQGGFTPPWQQGGAQAAATAYAQPQQAPVQQPVQQGAPWQQPQQPQQAPQGAPAGTPPWQR